MNLNSADSAFDALLRQHLPDGALKPSAPRYLEEPRGRYHGRETLVALPRNVEEVATIIRLAGQAR